MSFPKSAGEPRSAVAPTVSPRRVIRRGLRAEPADRFPDMAALLDALDRVRRPAWPRWALGATAVGLVVLGILLQALATPDEAPREEVIEEPTPKAHPLVHQTTPTARPKRRS